MSQMVSTRAVLAIVLTVALVSLPAAEVSTPAFADKFVDSVGVNVHLHYMGTPYDNFEMVRARLAELGVRHLRDGLVPTTWQPYYDRHNALGAMGIKGTFIAGVDATNDALRAFPTRVSSSFEAYEAANEYDISGVSAWTGPLRQSLTLLRALRTQASLASYPVYGPSLTSVDAYAALGDVSAYFDAANLHNYFQGRHPGTQGWGADGYGSIDWNLALAKRYAPGRPVTTTETGYWDDPGVRDSIPANLAGRYMPRLLLEQFRKGITRTFVYELIDAQMSGVEAMSGYGLVRADGSPKPAFRAVANLLKLFNDPGPAVTARQVSYTLDGGDGNVRQMAFQKRDATMLLAVWVEASGFDLNTRQPIAVPPQTVRISAPTGLPLSRVTRWLEDGSVLDDTSGAGRTNFTLVINDSLTVVQFDSARHAVPRAPVNLRILD